jgi:hypothetical protein
MRCRWCRPEKDTTWCCARWTEILHPDSFPFVQFYAVSSNGLFVVKRLLVD